MPSEFPTISIVVPNLNQAGFIRESLDSILDQNYPNIEVIVVDGGSTDESLKIIETYKSRLRHVLVGSDKGHYDAVNKGFAIATGEVLAFLNSDDKLFPESLQTIGEVFSSHVNIEWATSLLPALWDVYGRCIAVTPIPGYNSEAFLDGMYGGGNAPWFIQQESTFWRRSLWEKAGGRIRDEFSHAGDFDLWGRFFQHAELYGLQSLLGGFRIREGQRLAEGSLYADQSRQCLMRFRSDHSPLIRHVRKRTFHMGLYRTKFAGGLLRHFIGYSGKCVIRTHPESKSAAAWKIKDYLFP